MTDHPSDRPADNLGEIFTYHAPDEHDLDRYRAIRGAARKFAEVIATNCPPCADTSAALRAAREAVMWANAAIALEPPASLPTAEDLGLDDDDPVAGLVAGDDDPQLAGTDPEEVI